MIHLVSGAYYKTDYDFPREFFQTYLHKEKWVEANILYGQRITDITENKKFVDHYINHVNEYDRPLKKFVIRIFKALGIQSKDFRCDFFLTKPKGYLPEHVDSQSKIAVLIPLTKNTGALKIKHPTSGYLEVLYQSMLILNTQMPHQVLPPEQDRLMFRIGIHDIEFDQINPSSTKLEPSLFF